MKLRGGLPLVIFSVLLVAVPILEVWLLIGVSRQVGGWQLIAILVGELLLGAWLLRREGSRAWGALNAAFTTGRVPTGELADAALILVGGVLLMLPGFITDFLGLTLLLPITRPVARRILAFFVARRINKLGGAAVLRRTGAVAGAGTIIRGETVAETSDPPDAQPPSNQPPSNQPPSSAPTKPVVITGEVTEGPPADPRTSG